MILSKGHKMKKVSVWSAYLMESNPEEMIAEFANHGFKYTELSDEHGKELIQRGAPVKVGRALREYAEGYDFSFIQGHLWLKADIVNPSFDQRLETIDELKKWLELFSALGIRAGVLHPGGAKARGEGWSEEKISDVRSESLKILTDFIQDMPISIAIENCGENIDQLLAIVDGVDSDSLGICLDTGHLNLIKGNQGEFIHKCDSKLLALHIADNLGVNDDHMLPYSKGTVDWKDVINALHDINYDGLFNFEVPGERHCPAGARLVKLDYMLKLGELMMENV
jgi:sugar phosphate isomerase/epimerase